MAMNIGFSLSPRNAEPKLVAYKSISLSAEISTPYAFNLAINMW